MENSFITLEPVRIKHGKRVIGVRVIEVLMWSVKFHSYDNVGIQILFILRRNLILSTYYTSSYICLVKRERLYQNIS